MTLDLGTRDPGTGGAPFTGAAPATTDNRLLRHGFRIAGAHVVDDGNSLVELLEMEQPTRLPNTPLWLAGLISVRGTLVPVFDLEKFHDSPQTSRGKPMLIVVGSGERSAALIIRGLPVLLRFGPEAARAAPAGVPEPLREFTTGAYRDANQTWLEVDFDSLFVHLGRQLNPAFES